VDYSIWRGALQQLIYRQKTEDVYHQKQDLNSCWDSHKLIDVAIEQRSKRLSSVVCLFHEFVKKMWLILFLTSSLANCKTKYLTAAFRCWPLSCKQFISGYFVENHMTVMCGFKNVVPQTLPFFLEHHVYNYI